LVDAAPGVNVNEMLQLLPAASVVPHVVVSTNTFGLAPPRVTPAMVSGAFPPFESVTICAADVLPTVVAAKVNPAAGESDAWATVAAVPVPLSEIVWGDPVTLSDRVIVAGKLAALCGLNSMVNVQVVDTAREVPQVDIRA